MRMTVNDVLLWLSLSEVSAAKQRKLFERFDGVTEFYDSFLENKAAISEFLSKDVFERLITSFGEEFVLQQKAYLTHSDIKYISFFDEAFPVSLKQSEVDPPYILFYQGDITLLNSTCVAVVGTRTPSPYGKNQCRAFVEPLSNAGVTIVSGLATGIDTVAHEQCLACGGKTVAVLGLGINAAYKSFSGNLLKDIAAKGLVISEFPPDKLGAKYTFPQRNRLISGLSQGVLIVEAAMKSGALITADFALEQNRELYAVCGNLGNVYSTGTNNLIKHGKAQLVTEAQDILRTLKIEAKKDNKNKSALVLDIFEQKLYNLLSVGQLNFDSLIEAMQTDVVSLNRLLVKMELKGLLIKLPQNFYSIR